jgi:hypothetical protein
MRSVGTSICTATILSLLAATPASPQQIEPSAGGEIFEKMQSEFAEAYNRKDVPAMAAFFSDDAVRIYRCDRSGRIVRTRPRKSSGIARQ